MEKFQEAREKARKNIKVADHMAYITYNIVKDPKLLLAIMENIYLSLLNALRSILYYERTFKNIPAFSDNFEAQLLLFRNKVAPKHNISPEYADLLTELRDMLIKHKKSPVEFVRKDRFVICGENYKMKTVSIDEMKRYVAKAKEFIRKAERVTSENERIFV